MVNQQALAVLADSLAERNVDLQAVKQVLKLQTIELPSWGFGDSGTRFKVFKQKGAARDIFEKLADTACVHRLTGVAPSVAVHVLWDFVDVDIDSVVAKAQSLGVRIGAVNPNLFEGDEYKYGSLANPDPAIQQQALAHVSESIDIMRTTGSKCLNLWLADGTNYPGQDSLVGRKRRTAKGYRRIHELLDNDMTMVLEYKFFEPSFYSTDMPDWGAAYVSARQAGPKAKVLVDLGHHPHGTNIEQIVAFLIDENMLGGFHFNSRKYADDDLTTSSMAPYELFLIFNELVTAAGGCGIYDAAYMIDQSHNIKPKIEAMIQSVMALQETYAKALCLDRGRLSEAQNACDVVAAEQLLKQAFFTDVTPLLAEVREEMGLAPDPLAAYRQSGYQEKIEARRS